MPTVNFHRFPLCFAFPLLVFCGGATELQAQSILWLGNNGTNATQKMAWSRTGNWTGGNIPNVVGETATFTTSTVLTPTIANFESFTIGGITFNSGASAFTVSIAKGGSLTIGGAGIANNSGSSSTVETISNKGTLIFENSASAGVSSGSSAAIRLTTSATADASHTLTQFNGSSATGNAIITNLANPSGSNAAESTIVFNNTSGTGGTAISNTAMGSGFAYATISFNGTSTASTSTINSSAPSDNGAAFLEFHDSSTAASSTLNLSTVGTGGSFITFYGNSTAGSAHLNLDAGTMANFWDDSTAGSATIAVTSTFAGLDFNGTTANAGSATITSIGGVNFEGSSSAGSANITMNPSDYNILSFRENSTAANSHITLDYAALSLEGSATAGNATIALTNGSGMSISGAATGGNASFTFDSSSSADLSFANGPTVVMGSIAGSGQIYVGSSQLQVGGNNASTTFSGQLFDGGYNGGAGGGLTKVGTGTLELGGNNQYTGPTNINAGKLLVNGSIFNSSLTTVNSGATLGGYGSVGALTVASGGTVAPGNVANSFGTLHVYGTTTFNGGGSYQWNIDNAYEPFGRWDHLEITGALDLTSLANADGNRFIIALQSLALDSNTSGNVFNFDATANYSFTLASASDGILGFSTGLFTIDASGFTNNAPGTWSIARDGNNLNLLYMGGASAIPEPSTYAGVVGVFALGLSAWRRRLQRSRV